MYGETPKLMATALISTMVDYMKQHGRSTLELIDIIIYQNVMIKDYAAVLKEAVSSQRTSNLSNILARRRGKTQNVYQVSHVS